MKGGRIFRKFVAEVRLPGAYQGGICRDGMDLTPAQRKEQGEEEA